MRDSVERGRGRGNFEKKQKKEKSERRERETKKKKLFSPPPQTFPQSHSLLLFFPLTSVGVDDDLASGEPRVAVRAADHEPARGVEVEDRVGVEVLGRDDGLDHVLLEVLGDLLVGHVGAVLGGDEDGVDADGDHGAACFFLGGGGGGR